MRGRRRGVQATVVAAVVSAALLVSACGGSNSAAPPTTSAEPTTTDAPATTTTADPTSVVVLQAYRLSWSAFEHAAADANPEEPELATTMVDPQLQGVKANLLADQRQGSSGGARACSPGGTTERASPVGVDVYSDDLGVVDGEDLVPQLGRGRTDPVGLAGDSEAQHDSIAIDLDAFDRCDGAVG